MEFIHSFTAEHAVLFSGGILLAAYIVIASEKINKVPVALIGACATILLGLVSTTKTGSNGSADLRYYVNFIDFNVVFLLVGMMIIVSITARSGIFNLVSEKMLVIARGNPMGILACLGVFTGVLSAFLDNVTTVILVLPITFAACEKLKITPVPFLLTEVFASNIGGTATLIGDPPNIIIGNAAGFSFMDFLRELTPAVAVILALMIAFVCLLFRRELKADAAVSKSLLEEAKAKKVPVDKPLAIRSLAVLFCVITGFVLYDYTRIPASIVALLGAAILMLFEKPEILFREVEWNTIFFFIGLFIIIGGLEASGGIKIMADYIVGITGGSQELAAIVILWGSGLVSGVIDNIPFTATMAPMILEMEKSFGAEYVHPLWWSLSLGACLGGNMTIIGAAANVIVGETSARHGHRITFLGFLKYGFLVTVMSLIVSSAYLVIRFFA